MNDNEILDLFFSRSEDAITSLDEKYGRLYMNLAVRITGSPEDAKECVNDAYLAAWNNIPPEKPTSLSAYVCALTRNISLNRYRDEHSKKRKGNYGECLEELEDSVFSSGNIDDILSEKELTAHINSFLSSLGEIDRMIFVRRYWYIDSYGDISKLTGLREGTVRVRIARTKKKLKLYLEKEGVII